MNKKLFTSIMALIMIVNFLCLAPIKVSAHETILDVEYDPCLPVNHEDGIDEMWYVLDRAEKYCHFPDDLDMVTYRFMGDTEDWVPNGFSQETGEEIKTMYANSMEKWNNVYFYSHNADGTITKNKLINVVQITEGEPNISIFPATTEDIDTAGATTEPLNPENVENGIENHKHATSWMMQVNIEAFHEGTPFTDELAVRNENLSADIALIRECTGAHELGHVLGLLDLDHPLCDAGVRFQHHQEVLMGYGTPVRTRSADITYKDIAGVAILRGFHTDADHEWLSSWDQDAQKFKLICWICNGVKYVDSLDGYTHSTYGACEGDHENLLYYNMKVVASYGNTDYYKCGYCRYVTPFSENMEQNYVKTCHCEECHECENTVRGLEYTFYEGHYIYDSNYTGGQYATCAGCGYQLDLSDAYCENVMLVAYVSANGSYILSTGIPILVDEDVEAYLAGTLQFYHPDDLPVTE